MILSNKPTTMTATTAPRRPQWIISAASARMIAARAIHVKILFIAVSY